MTHKMLHARLGKPTVGLMLGLVISGAAGVAVADYVIVKSTVDDGGVSRIVGAVYELSGTNGQHDAGSLAGGRYALTGGFWQAAAAAGDIPTVSTWGMVGMALLLLAAGTLVYGWRRPALQADHYGGERCCDRNSGLRQSLPRPGLGWCASHCRPPLLTNSTRRMFRKTFCRAIPLDIQHCGVRVLATGAAWGPDRGTAVTD